jgi:hypothetical protein
MKKLSNIQKEWLGWLLIDQRNWFDKHTDAFETGRLRIRKAYLNMEYDTMTEHLLNYILEEFNKDDGMKNKWKNERAWKIKSNN